MRTLVSMRILHTSDWHLGRAFGDFSLLEEQEQFVDWLVQTAVDEQAELVVIAGDLHDRAVPPVAAVSLFSEAVRRLREIGAEVVAIAGNHDSGERIGAFDGLVDAGGVVIRGGYRAASSVTIRDYSDGPLAIVALPFLEPLMAPVETRAEILDAGRSPRLSHEAVLAHAIETASADLPVGMRSLVLAHAFVTGAAPSDSERELAVGDSGMVSADLFDPFDYVAPRASAPASARCRFRTHPIFGLASAVLVRRAASEGDRVRGSRRQRCSHGPGNSRRGRPGGLHHPGLLR